MNKKIVIGCVLISFLMLFASFPSVVGFHITNPKLNNYNEIITAIHNLKVTTDGWHLGFFIELIIGTIFILLILLGILNPDE